MAKLFIMFCYLNPIDGLRRLPQHHYSSWSLPCNPFGLQCKTNSTFLFHGPHSRRILFHDPHHILGFGSKKFFKKLCSAKTIHLDCTFKVCPAPFSQLVTFCSFHHDKFNAYGESENIRMAPRIYFLHNWCMRIFLILKLQKPHIEIVRLNGLVAWPILSLLYSISH